MSEIYNNEQAAGILGISPNTIRSWKSKNSSELKENQHWFSENGSTYWTQDGIEALKLIQTTIRGKAAPTTDTGSPTTETDPEQFDPIARWRPLIKTLALSLRPRLIRELDQEILAEAKDAISQPMTAEECVAVLVELNFPPLPSLSALNQVNFASLPEQQEN